MCPTVGYLSATTMPDWWSFISWSRAMNVIGRVLAPVVGILALMVVASV
jgi:hypothetical protein